MRPISRMMSPFSKRFTVPLTTSPIRSLYSAKTCSPSASRTFWKILCCSGFDLLYHLELHLEIRARDRAERHAVCLPVLAVDQHVAALDAAEPPPEESLAVDRLAHHDLRDASGEAAVVVRAAQRAI